MYICLVCRAALEPAFQPNNRDTAQQSISCCICGGSTAGRDSSFYPCYTYIIHGHGQDQLEQLKRTLSIFKGKHDESVWVQCADMQGFSSGHAVTAHCSSTPLSGLTLPSDEYLLGLLVSVVDEVASNFVYGPCGTTGRPKGVMDITIIESLAASKLLSSACHNRWLKFLQQWQTAGWSVDELLEFAGTMRPLQYNNYCENDTYIDGVTKEDLLKRITELYATLTFTLMGQSDVENFVEVVACHFSKPNAVLLPVAHDVYNV